MQPNRNILWGTQQFICDKLNTQLSSVCPFIPENQKDIDFQIKQALGKQGIVGICITPKATHIGRYQDTCNAWECDIELDVIENPAINRTQPLSSEYATGQDVSLSAFDILSPVYGEHEGQFLVVGYEQGEDGGLLVNKATLKTALYGDEEGDKHFVFWNVENGTSDSQMGYYPSGTQITFTSNIEGALLAEVTVNGVNQTIDPTATSYVYTTTDNGAQFIDVKFAIPVPEQLTYGVKVETMLGVVDENGVLQRDTRLYGLNMAGVKALASGLRVTALARNNANCLSSVSWPDLLSATSYNITTCYSNQSYLTKISFPKLSATTGDYVMQETFINCPQLGKDDELFVPFPEYQNCLGYGNQQRTFQGCTSIKAVSYPKLKVVGDTNAFNDTFKNCTNLSAAYFPELTYIGYNPAGTTPVGRGDSQFRGTFIGTQVHELNFPKLEKIYHRGTSAGPFYGNTTLSAIYLPACYSLSASNSSGSLLFFDGCTNLQELHFGLANKTTIEALPGYANKFGAPNTCQILFDL